MYEVINNSIITMNLTEDERKYLRGLNFLAGMNLEEALEALYNNIFTRKELFFDVIVTTVIVSDSRGRLMIQRPKRNKDCQTKKAE